MIDINKTFDKIYVISYVKNYDRRKNILKYFKYHNITNFEFIYSIDIPRQYIKDELIELLGDHYLSVSYTHYRTMKIAYDLGYENILIFEDDAVFTDDKLKFNRIIEEAVTSKNDIYFLDYIYFEPINSWQQIKGQWALYINRKGMEFYIKNHEKNMKIIDDYIIFNLETHYPNPEIYYDNYNIYLDESTIDTKIDFSKETIR